MMEVFQGSFARQADMVVNYAGDDSQQLGFPSAAHLTETPFCVSAKDCSGGAEYLAV
jgi:hypothetical protein